MPGSQGSRRTDDITEPLSGQQARCTSRGLLLWRSQPMTRASRPRFHCDIGRVVPCLGIFVSSELHRAKSLVPINLAAVQDHSGMKQGKVDWELGYV